MNSDTCILLNGDSRWAFENFALALSEVLSVDVSSTPRRWNYLLCFEPSKRWEFDSFIPLEAIELAADKRRIATAFNRHKVPSPETVLIETVVQVRAFVDSRPDKKWCLKFPTSCGGAGHRIITSEAIPENWPRPYVVQEFIELESPEVFRTYATGGEIFGFVARRYLKDVKRSPWVAHAQGAFYEVEPSIPPEVHCVAESALRATGSLESFGCVDLIRRHDGQWLALEVGTDGIYNHVDRDIGSRAFEQELSRRLAKAFWKWVTSSR